MKAIIYTKYGSPEVLSLVEIQKPIPKGNEVLIKIHAASTNPADWHILRAKPFLARLVNGLFKPKNPQLGADVAGRIEAVGAGVTQFHVGDDVFGCAPLNAFGTFAEYICVAEELLELKPANTTFEQAAAVPLAALTALQGLRDKGHIKPGQKILINGASGGVGTFAVQIAKSFGTEVTGVCSTGNATMVRSIGADHTIDYTLEDFTRTGEKYDLIFDAVGNRKVSDYSRALSANGVCAVAGFTSISRLLQIALLGMWVTKTGTKEIGMMATMKINKQDLILIRELLETGKVVPVIDRSYPLEQLPEAISYLETGRAKGKVVILISQE